MKVTIREFEKELKKIDENAKVVKADKFDSCDYIIRFNLSTTHLCGFNVGRLEGLRIDIGNTYDRDISDRVLNKAIKLIPHLVPDDYKEPTKDELFKNFTKKVNDKGFYLTGLTPSFYKLEFHEQGRRWFIGEIDKINLEFEIIQQGNAPRDRYLEGLKLLIDYIEKARSLEPVKLYEIPLPGLKATDGEKQYLSTKNGYYFTCRKNNELKQTWTEKELINVPKAYREYAVEVEDEI